MSDRITNRHIEALVERINAATGSPAEPYVRADDEGGKARYVAQVGCYHLSGAYGGVALHRMSNECGGVSDVFGCGHMPKRELYGRMRAFLAGVDAVTVAE